MGHFNKCTKLLTGVMVYNLMATRYWSPYFLPYCASSPVGGNWLFAARLRQVTGPITKLSQSRCLIADLIFLSIGADKVS